MSKTGKFAWENYRSVRNSSVESIKVEYRQKRFDPNNTFRGQTLLTASVLEGRPHVLQLLLELGARPNVKSEEGGRKEPPLITAVRLRNYSCVRVLTFHGASVAATNFYGECAIYQAVVENAYEILEHLLTLPFRGGGGGGDGGRSERKGGFEHNPVQVCPFHLALRESLKYPSKKRCFALLLRFNLNCGCLLKLCSRLCLSGGTSSSQEYDGTDSTSSTWAGEEIIKVDHQIMEWIYLFLGYPPSPRFLTPSAVKEEEINGSISIQGVTAEGAKVIPFPIKLKHVVRVSIRTACSIYSSRFRTSFKSVIISLPLPPRLINFLLLDDIQIPGNGVPKGLNGRKNFL